MKSGKDESKWTNREDRVRTCKDEPRGGSTPTSVLVSDAGGVSVLWELDAHLAQEQGAGGARRGWGWLPMPWRGVYEAVTMTCGSCNWTAAPLPVDPVQESQKQTREGNPGIVAEPGLPDTLESHRG